VGSEDLILGTHALPKDKKMMTVWEEQKIIDSAAAGRMKRKRDSPYIILTGQRRHIA